MYSTHYMDLLMQNSPWNLILFMVIPVVAAEALVAAAFYALFLGEGKNAGWRKFEKQLGIFAGVYFAGVVTYLLTSVVPTLEWKGLLDQMACSVGGIVAIDTTRRDADGRMPALRLTDAYDREEGSCGLG